MKKFVLAAYIIYLPFQLKLPQLPLINTLNLFLALLTLIFIFGRNKHTSGTGFEAPLLIFLFIWAVSFMHTLLNPLGMWRYEITVLFKRLITLVLGYFVFSRCVKTKKELYFLFYIFLTALVLVGLYTYRGGMLAGTHFADFKRASGPFGEEFRGADIAGGFLAIFTPFLLSFTLLTKNKKTKLLALGGLLICIIGIFTTYSRGSILALGAASIITVFATIRQLLKTSRISALLIFLLFIALAVKWQVWVPESIIHRAKETTQERTGIYVSPELDESSQSRIDKWKFGIEIFKMNPLFGMGFGVPEFMLSTDTHNAFIQTAAEMGVFGILVFIWFLIAILLEAKRLLNTEFNIIAVGFIGCIIAFVFVNMFYSNFFRDTVVGTFWVMLGILTSCKRYAIQQK